MRLFILLLTLGLIIIFFWHNSQPISLVFFGSNRTPELSISIWMLVFTTAGIISSLFLQILQNLSLQSSANLRQKTTYLDDISEPEFEPREEENLSEDSKTLPEDNRRKKGKERNTSKYRDDSEWEEWDNEEDWYGEQIPRKKPSSPKQDEEMKSLQENIQGKEDRVFPQAPNNRNEPSFSQEESANFEVPQKPQKAYRSGSIYSYGYKEKSKDKEKENPEPREARKVKKESKNNQVYDANYRVITPPYRSPDDTPTELNEDEEDWI